MRWFVRGDLDGFFGLALDNLVQVLVIDALCRYVLGFSDALLYGRVLPGVAVSLLVGNVYYGWQAKRLADATGRTDVCALPYGINTPSVFAYVFLVMLPAKLAAEAAGLANPELWAWRAGLVACLGSGLIEFGGAFVAERVRQAAPRAALLSTLAGIALTFIALSFVYRTYAFPVVGLTCLGVVLLTYFGGVRFKGGLPGGLVAVVVGTALAWGTGVIKTVKPETGLGFYPPIPVIGELFQVPGAYWKDYLGVILPMGLFNVLGSLQNIESAEAAGDRYPTEASLAINGVGTMAAALFGSCFPTTIYIGHPGWKALGARAGYSIANGVFFTLLALTGTAAYVHWAVPIEAGMAIVLWIGIVITAQAFAATPAKHAPAVVVGILPGIAAWGALLLKTVLRAVGYGPGGPAFEPGLIEKFNAQDLWANGAFALEQGFIFTAMLLSGATVMILERRFRQAAGWMAIAAVLSATGLMHGYQFTPSDTVLSLRPATEWAIGYGLMALLFVLAPWICEASAEHEGDVEGGAKGEDVATQG